MSCKDAVAFLTGNKLLPIQNIFILCLIFYPRLTVAASDTLPVQLVGYDRTKHAPKNMLCAWTTVFLQMLKHGIEDQNYVTSWHCYQKS